jgi:hypothetical protein
MSGCSRTFKIINLSVSASIHQLERAMTRFIAPIALAACLLFPAVGSVYGADPHNSGSTGQPSKECEATRPGNAATAPGSAFNPNGVAGTVYAGEQPQNSKNPKSVSQYDVACFQQPP